MGYAWVRAPPSSFSSSASEPSLSASPLSTTASAPCASSISTSFVSPPVPSLSSSRVSSSESSSSPSSFSCAVRNIGSSCASENFSSPALGLSSSSRSIDSGTSGSIFSSGLELAAATFTFSRASSSGFFADLCVEGNGDIAVSVTSTVEGGGGISLEGWLGNSIALGGWIAPAFPMLSPLIVTFFSAFASKTTAEAVAASSSVSRARGLPSICGPPADLVVSVTPPMALLAVSIPRARFAASILLRLR